MRDFSCCGLRLATLHDLLEHYEENHSQQLEELNRRTNEGPRPDPKAAIASNAAAALKDPAQAQQQEQARQRQEAINQQAASQQLDKTQLLATGTNYPSQVEETVGDMEMDDDFSATAGVSPYQVSNAPNVSQFGRPPAPRLDMSATAGSQALLQHQGLRQSTPTTPVSTGRNGPYYQNNPTVSSVNTPTLSAHPTHLQQQQYFTPDSSAPGTPGEIDPDVLNNMSSMNMNMSYLPPTTQPPNYDSASNWGYPSSQQQSEMLDLCIDEPAKRLFQANGIFSNNGNSNNITASNPSGNSTAQSNANSNQAAQSTSAQQLGDNQYTEDSDLARTIREQQKLAGVPDPSADGVPKPFHCPVIGCEKAYKNQNGLKYHKSVSLISPTSQPYLLTSPSTVTILKLSTQTPTAPSASSIRKPSNLTLGRKAWKNINPTSANHAASATRTSTVSSTTNHTLNPVILRYGLATI